MKINKKSELKQGEKKSNLCQKTQKKAFSRRREYILLFQRVSSQMLQNKILHSCWVSALRVLIGKTWTSSQLTLFLRWVLSVYRFLCMFLTFYQIPIIYLMKEESLSPTRSNARAWGFFQTELCSRKNTGLSVRVWF